MRASKCTMNPSVAQFRLCRGDGSGDRRSPRRQSLGVPAHPYTTPLPSPLREKGGNAGGGRRPRVETCNERVRCAIAALPTLWRWGPEVSTAADASGGRVYPSLCLPGTSLLVGNDAGKTIILEPGDRYAPVGSGTLPGGSGGTPTFSGRRMYVRGGEFLYCVAGPEADPAVPIPGGPRALRHAGGRGEEGGARPFTSCASSRTARAPGI